MIVISNTFSLKMIGYNGNSEPDNNEKSVKILVESITVDEIRHLIEYNEWASIVGHSSTARLFSQTLGALISCNRVNYIMEPEDILIVGLVNTSRLPEGVILTDNDLKDVNIDWRKVTLI